MVWTTKDSTLAGAFKVAGYGHSLNFISGDQTVKTMSYSPNTATAPSIGIVTPTDGKYSLIGLETYSISNLTGTSFERYRHRNVHQR